MRAGLVQITASDDPAANLPETRALIAEAAQRGASFVLTPEVTNCLSASRVRQTEVLQTQAEDQTLASLCKDARAFSVWILIGSLALKTNDPDGRFVNRSFMISPNGQIVAWYDKMHMFDVQISELESYRESAGYRPGKAAVLADTPFGSVGMTVCYDMRFPTLYRALAQQGAEIIAVPSAFSPVTGAAHWEILLRARAIETGCFVLAPAQCGAHSTTTNKQRKTFGHSLAVSPWGEVLADGGTEPGVTLVDFDLAAVEIARNRIPSLTHDRKFTGP